MINHQLCGTVYQRLVRRLQETSLSAVNKNHL